MHGSGVSPVVFLFPLLLVVLGYAIAFTRKGKVATATLGSRRHELRSNASPQEVFERIKAFRGKLSVDDMDPGAHILVLSSPVTLFSWGFLFPVFIHAEGAGSRIEIGIHSKFMQYGPVVTRWHRTALEEIQQALTIPEARIA